MVLLDRPGLLGQWARKVLQAQRGQGANAVGVVIQVPKDHPVLQAKTARASRSLASMPQQQSCLLHTQAALQASATSLGCQVTSIPGTKNKAPGSMAAWCRARLVRRAQPECKEQKVLKGLQAFLGQ